MTDMLRVVKSAYAVKKGSWVRVKRGIYRDDLAKVEQCDMAQNLVTLKLFPRIDYSKKRGFAKSNSKDSSDLVPETHQNFKKKNRFAFKRPPAIYHLLIGTPKVYMFALKFLMTMNPFISE